MEIIETQAMMPDIKHASKKDLKITKIPREREEYYQNRNFTTTTHNIVIININKIQDQIYYKKL